MIAKHFFFCFFLSCFQVCESVLGDLDISKNERKKRAKGLRIMGEIYEKVGSKEQKRLLKEEERKRKEAQASDAEKGKEKADTAGETPNEGQESVSQPPAPSTEDID